MSKSSFWLAGAAGLAAIAWVAFGFVGTHPIALAMTLLIAAAYLLGVQELRRHRADTAALAAALAQEPPAGGLREWLASVPPTLRSAVRLRVEEGRGALPGPALTPYLVGLLVMLGMLGTFLGMVVTFRGAVFALEGSTDLGAIRAALAEPIRGLGLSFGTSVAGVAASAMLGLMSAIARHARLAVARELDQRAATTWRAFSSAHQREEALRAAQAQADLLPAVVEQLATLMDRMEQRQRALDEQLLASHAGFQRESAASLAQLADRVGGALRDSLAAGAAAAGDSVRPVVEGTMGRLEQQAQLLHARLGDVAEAQVARTAEQLDRLVARTSAQLEAGAAHMAQQAETLATRTVRQVEVLAAGTAEQVNTLASRTSQQVESLAAQAWQQMESLATRTSQHMEAVAAQTSAQVESLATRTSEQVESLATRTSGQVESLAARTSEQVESLATRTSDHVETLAARTAAQAEALTTRTSSELATQTDRIAAQVETHTARTTADVARLLAHSEALVREREQSEARWLAEHGERLDHWGGLWRTQLEALRAEEARRGDAAVQRLDELQAAVAQHLASLGAALEAPLARLLQTASEVPEAAAGVLAQLRQEMAQLAERENVSLQERTVLVERLGTLLQALEAAARETAATAAQAGANAVELSSWGEAFAHSVQLFHAGNEQLVTALKQVEAAVAQSTARSDEQVAYYVAQAREVIDLSIASQHGVIERLRELAQPAPLHVVQGEPA